VLEGRLNAIAAGWQDDTIYISFTTNDPTSKINKTVMKALIYEDTLIMELFKKLTTELRPEDLVVSHV